MMYFEAGLLKEKILQSFLTAGLNQGSARHVTDSIVSTSLRGVDSHGINLFPHYMRAIESGRINRQPDFVFERKSTTTSVLDADHAIGHHAGAVAMEEALSVAKKHGMGAVAVKNSTHFGAAAYFGLMAPEQGCIGFSFTNADALVKVPGAAGSFFGTNPICFCAPLQEEEPLCLDMATSMISWNKINNYRRDGSSVPDSLAFDENGQVTKDPHAARSLAPAGDYKGFGLGMMVDILTALLSGSLISKDIKPMYTSPIEDKRYISHFFMALDISSFSDDALFAASLQSMVNRIRAMESIDSSQILVPGDPEKRTYTQRMQHGIPVDSVKYDEFCAIDPLFKDCLC